MVLLWPRTLDGLTHLDLGLLGWPHLGLRWLLIAPLAAWPLIYQSWWQREQHRPSMYVLSREEGCCTEPYLVDGGGRFGRGQAVQLWHDLTMTYGCVVFHLTPTPGLPIHGHGCPNFRMITINR